MLIKNSVYNYDDHDLYNIRFVLSKSSPACTVYFNIKKYKESDNKEFEFGFEVKYSLDEVSNTFKTINIESVNNIIRLIDKVISSRYNTFKYITSTHDIYLEKFRGEIRLGSSSLCIALDANSLIMIKNGIIGTIEQSNLN